MSSTPPALPEVTVIGFKDVQAILEKAARSAQPDHDGQGHFWMKPLNEFIKSVVYGVQVIADPGPDRGEKSGLIKALRGQTPFDNSTFPRMPMGMPAVSDVDIGKIQKWIDAGCPSDPIIVKMEVTTHATSASASPPVSPKAVFVAPKTGFLALDNTNALRGDMESVKIRKNILNLTDEELNNFRAAIQKLKDLPSGDHRNYTVQADLHGKTAPGCRHGTVKFLTWHRVYLYYFEKALQDFLPSVTLPYWDWINTREIPKAYLDKTYTDSAGKVLPNPLYHDGRDPGLPDNLPTKAEFDDAQGKTTSDEYVGAMPFGKGKSENMHDTVHGWVGGDMGVVTLAAYDPVFWAHHSQCDRIWNMWQTANPGVDPTPEAQKFVLAPWSQTISDSLHVSDFGYEYANDTRLLLTNTERSIATSTTGPVNMASHFNGKTPSKIVFQLHNVQHPKNSFSVRVFVNEPDAGVSTKTEGNPHYAGRLSFFGHGECIGGDGHCVPKERTGRYELRGPHHLTPYDVVHDLTSCIRGLGKGVKDIELTFVAVNAKGEAASKVALNVDAISLSVED
jgi:tyrosinase